jgi:hypothetical protein
MHRRGPSSITSSSVRDNRLHSRICCAASTSCSPLRYARCLERFVRRYADRWSRMRHRLPAWLGFLTSQPRQRRSRCPVLAVDAPVTAAVTLKVALAAAADAPAPALAAVGTGSLADGAATLHTARVHPPISSAFLLLLPLSLIGFHYPLMFHRFVILLLGPLFCFFQLLLVPQFWIIERVPSLVALMQGFLIEDQSFDISSPC